MAHKYDWPSGTGEGTGTCRLCGVTIRFVTAGSRGGKKREWRTVDGSVLEQGRNALDGEPPCLNGEVGPKPTVNSDTYEALSADHKRGLAELMWNARDIATRIPTTKRLMIAQIKHIAFYWTTSAFCPTRGLVVPDAIKLDVRRMHHTRSAHLAIDSGDQELIHEHAVPRSVLARFVTDEATSIEEVISIFDRHCLGVLVTTHEDSELNAGGFRDRMPPGWTWNDDRLARYAAIGLQVFDPAADTCVCSP
jgi:hypothetical protein